ncbi:MAG TPA: DNA repair protein RecN [Clostridiales bacterium]|nr:DNA repair protein RecN [Clostridiales bacterium]
MLSRIEIQDFALIQKAVFSPGPGLLILTGETGAGKSILIDAISVLGGGRINRDVIRHGQDKASVTAVFQQADRYLPPELLSQLGFTDAQSGEDEDLILSREILSSGKSICRVNGRLVSLSVLKDLSSCLIDIHGQHDQQAIFQTGTHLQLLDRYGAQSVEKPLQHYWAALREYQQCLQQMGELGQDPGERARQMDMLNYQVQEIDSARVRIGEDEQLALRRRVVANAGKIRAALEESYELLDGDSEETILAGLSQVLNRIDGAARSLPELSEPRDLLQETLYTLQNISGDLRKAQESVDCDPGELERIDERQDQLFKLKKKYGGSLRDVLDFGQKAKARLEQLVDGEARYAQLQAEQKAIRQSLLDLGQLLTAARRTAAAKLEQQITRELAGLGMKSVRFAVDFQATDSSSQHFPSSGLDQVEFLISANPGEPLKPLVRIASGGEASRIMLAVKSILAQADKIPVLIFDEIDTGVSGRTAGRVAEKLVQLSRGRQIFCITHLAQIAAMADAHYLIEKSAEGDQTRTRLRELGASDRELELARLLSGGVGDETARCLAEQLLQQAVQIKDSPAPAAADDAAAAESLPEPAP